MKESLKGHRILRMHRKILSRGVVWFLAFSGHACWGDEIARTQIFKSPDGRKQVEAVFYRGGDFARVVVVLTEGEKKLLETTIPPEKETRYIKVSWSPTSDALLVGVNYKAAEDWILIRLAQGKASSINFNGDTLLTAKLFGVLPFRDEIKNNAPVGRVPWKTVRWLDSKKCAMTYIFRGLGYEGTASLLIDFQGKNPTCTLTSINPTVDAELWKQD